MPRSPQQKRSHDSGHSTLSKKYDRIDSLLKEHLSYFPSKTDLTPEEIRNWHKDLEPFSLEAIEYAFDGHRRNALFFPLPANILDVCITYDPPPIPQNTCDAICKARHGKGYGEKDMFAAFELMRQAVSEKRKIDGEEILKIIDSKRGGGAPEFRREGSA